MASLVEVGDPVTADLLNLIITGSTNKPLCRLTQAATQSLTNATNTALTFGVGSEVVDTDGFHSDTVNTTRITPTRAGWYRFTGSMYIGSATFTALATGIRQNGATMLAPLGRTIPPASGGARGVPISLIAQANGTTDYFELMGQQDSGGSVSTVATGSNASSFECEFIRDL